MSEVSTRGAGRMSTAVKSAGAGTTGLLTAATALAHPGHPVGGQLLAEPLHRVLGVHWAVAEPLLMLAVVVVLSRMAGWAMHRVACWARAMHRAGQAE